MQRKGKQNHLLVIRFVMNLCQVDAQSILQYSSLNPMPKVHELAKEPPPT
jgi:uncharacterized membrane protein YcgQ (UPF0703/DUF1980 family)